MRKGSNSDAGRYGYFLVDALGFLSDEDFEIGDGAPAHTVENVHVGPDGALVFDLDRGFADAVTTGLVLHVCGESYPLGVALKDAGHAFTWLNAGLDWSPLSETGSRELVLSQPGNRPTLGAPAAIGTARVGETLTAVTSGIRDPDGLTGVSYGYRWFRVAGLTETEIAGETGSTYTLTADDLGKEVKVEVRFTDDLGFAEMLRSPATGTVAPVLVAPPSGGYRSANLLVKDLGDGNLGCSDAPSGEADACANTAVLSDDDFDFGTPALTYEIDRIGLTWGTLEVEFDRAIPNAIRRQWNLVVGGSTRLTFSEASFDVTGTRATWTGTGLSWSAGSTVGLKIDGGADTTPPELRTGRDSPGVGDGGVSVEAKFNEEVDLSNLPPASAFTVLGEGSPGTAFNVQGYNTVIGGNILFGVSPIIFRGQTATLSYTDPTVGDDAKAIQDLAGNDVPSFTVELRNEGTRPVPPGKPEIAGTAAVGETLTASPGDIDDDNGVTRAVYRYQWIRVDGRTWTDIPGEVYSTYRVVRGDLGKRFRVRVRFNDDEGHPETRTSDATARVTLVADPPDITIAPDRPSATGKWDRVRYTLEREGETTQSLTVAVTLVPPPGNDWEIWDGSEENRPDRRNHTVTFGAGESRKTLEIVLRGQGPGSVGFSSSATQSGTLVARLGDVIGSGTADHDAGPRPNNPLALVGPQAPPTRGPTPAAWRARRPARGALPWTTRTSYRRARGTFLLRRSGA